MTKTAGRRVRDERGSLTVAVLYWMLVAMLMAGLIVDGGVMISQHEKAIEIAQQAARAEANMLNPADLDTGHVQISTADRCQAAKNYLKAVMNTIPGASVSLDTAATPVDKGTFVGGCDYSPNGQTVTVFVVYTFQPVLGVPPFNGNQTIHESANATVEFTGEPGT